MRQGIASPLPEWKVCAGRDVDFASEGLYTMTAFNSRTLGGFLATFQRSNFACMYSQLSGDVFVAPAIRIAISGLNDALPFSKAESVFLVTPKRAAASVIVRPSGFIT